MAGGLEGVGVGFDLGGVEAELGLAVEWGSFGELCAHELQYFLVGFLCDERSFGFLLRQTESCGNSLLRCGEPDGDSGFVHELHIVGEAGCSPSACHNAVHLCHFLQCLLFDLSECGFSFCSEYFGDFGFVFFFNVVVEVYKWHVHHRGECCSEGAFSASHISD